MTQLGEKGRKRQPPIGRQMCGKGYGKSCGKMRRPKRRRTQWNNRHQKTLSKSIKPRCQNSILPSCAKCLMKMMLGWWGSLVR